MCQNTESVKHKIYYFEAGETKLWRVFIKETVLPEVNGLFQEMTDRRMKPRVFRVLIPLICGIETKVQDSYHDLYHSYRRIPSIAEKWRSNV